MKLKCLIKYKFPTNKVFRFFNSCNIAIFKRYLVYVRTLQIIYITIVGVSCLTRNFIVLVTMVINH